MSKQTHPWTYQNDGPIQEIDSSLVPAIAFPLTWNETGNIVTANETYSGAIPVPVVNAKLDQLGNRFMTQDDVLNLAESTEPLAFYDFWGNYIVLSVDRTHMASFKYSWKTCLLGLWACRITHCAKRLAWGYQQHRN